MQNIAIIGAGRMGKTHAEKLKDIKSCKLYGVYDPNKEAANAFIETYKMEKSYNSITELAKDPDLNGVVICNFTDQHYETLVELLSAGKMNIFCEKALVRKLAEGNEILKNAEKTGANIMVGHHRRYNPGYAKLKELISSGELGTIRMAKVSINCTGYAREWDDFFANFERSGGTILDMMTHMFDQLNWYFGEPARICGDGLLFDRSQPKPADYASGTLTYENGVICNLDCSWQRYGAGHDTIEVYGDKACAVYKGDKLLHTYRKDEHTEISLGNIDAYKEQMQAFIDMITDGKSPRTTLNDGFNSVKVALKLIEAIQAEQVLTFN